jgi:hypothetical protein
MNEKRHHSRRRQAIISGHRRCDSSAFSIIFQFKEGAARWIWCFRVGSIVGAVGYGDIGQPDISQFGAFVTEAIDKIEGKPVPVPTCLDECQGNRNYALRTGRRRQCRGLRRNPRERLDRHVAASPSA